MGRAVEVLALMGSLLEIPLLVEKMVLAHPYCSVHESPQQMEIVCHEYQPSFKI
jgi:hypothetical protein